MIDLKPLQISRILVLHYLLLVEMRLKALETVADDNDTHIVGWTINVDNKTNLRQPPENCAVQTKNKKLTMQNNPQNMYIWGIPQSEIKVAVSKLTHARAKGERL